MPEGPRTSLAWSHVYTGPQSLALRDPSPMYGQYTFLRKPQANYQLPMYGQDFREGDLRTVRTGPLSLWREDQWLVWGLPSIVGLLSGHED